MDGMGVEFAILDFLQTLHQPALDSFLVFITTLGNKGAVWIAIGILLLCSKKYRRGGILVLFSLALCLLLGNALLKNLVERPRPCWIRDTVPLLIHMPRDYSFPSGHSMSAFAAATALLFTDKRFGAAALVLAVLIAFSRLYLYVHWPTDVLAGALLGIGVAFFARYTLSWKEVRFPPR